MNLKASFRRWLRRLLLSRARTLSADRMMRMSLRGAQRAAIAAASRSEAYRTLLTEQQIDVDALRRGIDFQHLPVLTKDNTFARFSLTALAGPLDPPGLADVLTSSGRGGRTFGFRLASHRMHERSWFDIDLGLQDAFDVDNRATLIVNCLPMGVTFPSRAATVANVSVREDMACAILNNVGAHYQQVIVCTDPLFVNRLLAEAECQEVDWRALNASFILGEEMLVESQRDHIARRTHLDIDNDPHRWIGSSFGVGELGLNLLFETRESVRLNRRARSDQRLATALYGAKAAAEGAEALLFCCNPLRCHVEVLNPDPSGWGELCFTLLDTDAQIPLPRYATGDVGRLPLQDQVATAVDQLNSPLSLPWLPMVAVRGRQTDRGAGVPSVEQVKALIYGDPELAYRVTGAFKLGIKADGAVSLDIQLADPGTSNSDRLAAALERLASGLGPSAMVTCHSVGASHWGPPLDYERKFAYATKAP